MATNAHVHDFVELRRVIQHKPEQFDPFVICPERAKHADGSLHSDKEHVAKAPTPDRSPHGLNEVVFLCADPGCQKGVVAPIPAAKAKQLVADGLTDSVLAGLSYNELGVKVPK